MNKFNLPPGTNGHSEPAHYDDTLYVGGFPTVRASRSELAEMMVSDCIRARELGMSWRPRLVFSSNGQGIALAAVDANFRRTMKQADIVHADGMSVVFTSLLCGPNRLPERIATTDFIFDAASAASREKLSFFFLGGTEESSRGFVEWFKKQFPNVRVAGRQNGFFDEHEIESVLQIIRNSKPDVLWVGFGKPRQETQALSYRDSLPGIGWIKTCGGMYDYYSGVGVNRAPEWMQKSGLEWLYRSVSQPRKYAMRYLKSNLVAAWQLAAKTDFSWRR